MRRSGLSSLSTLTRSAETWRGCSPSPGFGTTGSLSLDACLPRPSSSTDLRRAVVGSEMAGGAWLGGPVASIGSWQGVRDASLHQPGQPHRGEGGKEAGLQTPLDLEEPKSLFGEPSFSEADQQEEDSVFRVAVLALWGRGCWLWSLGVMGGAQHSQLQP